MRVEAAAPRYPPLRPASKGTLASPHVAWPDSLAIRPTYWKEGAVIGGAVLGVGMFALGYAFCKGVSDTGGCLGSAAGVGALMTFCGGVIGALIGGAIEKQGATESPADP